LLFNIKLHEICGYRLTFRRYCATGPARTSLAHQDRGAACRDPPAVGDQAMSPVNARLRTLRNRFLALVAAGATALGLFAASAAPVKAETDNGAFFRFLLGAAALAIIVHELDDDDDDSDKPVVIDPGNGSGRNVPAACALEIDGMEHGRVAYSQNCLRSYNFRKLPVHCSFEARVWGKPDRLFPARCLRQAGFRLEPR
jgi:hypothetical protein